MKEEQMLLATTTVEDVDRFLEVFSTKGAEKRKEHGSKGATVFRDPNQDDRVWVIFDWNPEGWHSFVSDPEVPPIIKEAGHKGRAPGRHVQRALRRLTGSSRSGRVLKPRRERGDGASLASYATFGVSGRPPTSVRRVGPRRDRSLVPPSMGSIDPPSAAVRRTYVHRGVVGSRPVAVVNGGSEDCVPHSTS
jgi:hypothetical protein